MATTTPNFGWSVPTSTDYVKDGAVAIETLGDSIDASLVDLKGGTTGQVLSKNTNADMDFTWVTPNDADAIQNTIVDAKGDLISATAADTPARLAVGTDGQVLTADSTTATGLKWATASGGWTLIASATPSAATTLQFASIPTTYTQLRVVWDNCETANQFHIRLNNDSGSNYSYLAIGFAGNTTVAQGINFGNNKFGDTQSNAPIQNATNTTYKGAGYFQIERASSAGNHVVTWASLNYISGSQYYGPVHAIGVYKASAAVTQIDFIRDSTNTLTGNVYLYGMA